MREDVRSVQTEDDAMDGGASVSVETDGEEDTATKVGEEEKREELGWREGEDIEGGQRRRV